MAIELAAYADLLAERIVVLGGVALGTARTAATQSALPEYPSHLAEGHAHVQALGERFASYATGLRTNMTHATDVEDMGSAALYTDISRGIEKRLGLLDAYIHR
jgi:starvation-inducible DNA-binding protein